MGTPNPNNCAYGELKDFYSAISGVTLKQLDLLKNTVIIRDRTDPNLSRNDIPELFLELHHKGIETLIFDTSQCESIGLSIEQAVKNIPLILGYSLMHKMDTLYIIPSGTYIQEISSDLQINKLIANRTYPTLDAALGIFFHKE